jgi:hypothetical protein
LLEPVRVEYSSISSGLVGASCLRPVFICRFEYTLDPAQALLLLLLNFSQFSALKPRPERQESAGSTQAGLGAAEF